MPVFYEIRCIRFIGRRIIDKCDIINAINSAQQRTSDLLNGHWQSETERKLQDAKFEISQLKQNQYLAGLINGNGCCCNSNNTCC